MASASAGGAPPAAVIIPRTHPDGRVTRYRMMTPTRPGRWPVVLFSHGANSSSASYDRLWSAWAAHGFAVIGPDHVDTGPPAQQAKPPAVGLYASRVVDMSLPLHDRAAFDRAARDAGGALDATAVAVAGHSFGAVVAQALAGATLGDPAAPGPPRASTVDRTILACIALSPPGPRPGFVPADAWSSVRVPSLLQTGDADVLPGFVDDWRARLTGFAGGRDRWTLIGHGVDHYFGGAICRLRDGGEAQAAALDETASISSLFLVGYLLRDAHAREALAARARRGDDGVATFASAPSAGLAKRTPAMAAAAAGILVVGGGATPMPRRKLLLAAAGMSVWPALGRAASAPPAFPPSDTTPILGVSPPSPFPGPSEGSERVPFQPRAMAAAQAFSDGLGGTALLVSIDGRLVYERYAPGYDASSRLKTYSMAKSVMGIVYGLAVAENLLTLDDPLGRHVAEVRDDARGAITLRQLLQMRSGLKLESLARRDPAAIELVVGRRVTRIALATPLIGTPGAAFEYNNVNSFLAGLALDRALASAGKGRYADYLSRALWRPIGASDATLEVEFAPAGEPRFFAGLDACARDWLRIGSLFVMQGRVGERQVAPAAWLALMTTPSPNPSYGLQMWIGQPWTPQRRYGPNTPSVVACREPYAASDLVFFDGAGGQRVYMAPSRRLVIVRTGAASPDWEDSTLPNTIIRGLA